MSGIPNKDKVLSIANRLRAVSNSENMRATVLNELLAAIFEENPSPEVGAGVTNSIADRIAGEFKNTGDSGIAGAYRDVIATHRAELAKGNCTAERNSLLVARIRDLQNRLKEMGEK